MMGVGSSIQIKELKKIFTKPKKLILGLVLQILIFPIFALLIALISGLPPEYQIGIMILAACPGGTMSNFISYLIKADTPLSVGLTSTNSLVILLTIPLYLSLSFTIFFGNPLFVNLPFWRIISQVFFLLIIPVSIGVFFREYKTKTILKLQKPIKIIAGILLVIFFAIKFFSGESSGGINLSTKTFISILPWVLSLNIGGFLIGFLSAKVSRLNQKASTTMGIEIGLQNTVLALLITDVVLLQPLMGHPALIYAIFTFWTTLAFGFFALRRNKKQKTFITEKFF